MYNINVYRVLTAVMLLLVLAGGCGKSPYPDDVNNALKEAGENRAELEKVLAHYSTLGDSLMLQAAYYLIGNMEGHGYATYLLHDSSGAEVEFDVRDYADFDELLAAADSIEAARGELDFDKDTLIYDIHTISAGFIIDHIDYAFKAWREKPWAGNLSFENFCEYVLPYRGSNEPLENWRQAFWEKYKNIDTTMSDPADPIAAAALVNQDIMSWFGFDPRYYYHPTDQGLSEMKESGLGRCEDMTNLTIFAMRAVGLAVTSDYTPHWANSGNNHAWNSILTLDGTVIPFMGAECDPGKYTLHNKAAKVYRKTFGKKMQNLTFQDRKQEKIPGWLAGKSYVDVTSDYTDVCDVTITFTKEIPDSVDIAYLCVFNSGEWRAIHWGRIEADKAVFTDMGVDIAYIPALYLNEEIIPQGAPFVLGDDCDIRYYQPDSSDEVSISLVSTTKRKQAVSTDGIAESYLDSGQEYELFYWQDDWQSLGKMVATDKPLTFDKAPSGALYWLVAVGSDEEERIFTIEDDGQVWW
ncbi:MAG: transglutaminase domain-containing protein [candidate division Zixibacteria bacterium]|nr:transglutaminase domain-containing protein [candidate division Zixibacteria bacterium]